MRIALIATADAAGTDGGEPATIAGKSVARHQLDFALALGCGKVLCLGHGAAQAAELRYAAEGAGAQFQAIRGVRDLPASVHGDDQLLVLAQGLVPESARAFALLKEGYGVLVLPAETGWAAGFERLDLTAAWGGAMVIPGRLASRLDELPADAEPIAGLLRIARQDGVPERALPGRELAEGRWQIVRTADAAEALQPDWLRRHLPPVSPYRPSAWIARAALRRFGRNLVGHGRALAAIAAGSVVAMAAAVVAAWFGFPALAFALLAIGALANEGAEGLIELGRSVFIVETKASRLTFILRVIWDLALVACGFLAIDGSRAERAFAPLVLAGLLRIRPPWASAGWRALAADRGLLAALLALGAGVGAAEGAFMLLALLLILLRIAPEAEQGG